MIERREGDLLTGQSFLFDPNNDVPMQTLLALGFSHNLRTEMRSLNSALYRLQVQTLEGLRFNFYPDKDNPMTEVLAVNDFPYNVALEAERATQTAVFTISERPDKRASGLGIVTLDQLKAFADDYRNQHPFQLVAMIPEFQGRANPVAADFDEEVGIPLEELGTARDLAVRGVHYDDVDYDYDLGFGENGTVVSMLLKYLHTTADIQPVFNIREVHISDTSERVELAIGTVATLLSRSQVPTAA